MKRTKNPAKEAEYRKRAADLVAQMTLHEKVSQMLSWAPAIERLGIPAYNWWSEGIHGVGRAGTATVFPQAIGMAAAVLAAHPGEFPHIAAANGAAG